MRAEEERRGERRVREERERDSYQVHAVVKDVQRLLRLHRHERQRWHTSSLALSEEQRCKQLTDRTHRRSPARAIRLKLRRHGRIGLRLFVRQVDVRHAVRGGTVSAEDDEGPVETIAAALLTLTLLLLLAAAEEDGVDGD